MSLAIQNLVSRLTHVHVLSNNIQLLSPTPQIETTSRKPNLAKWNSIGCLRSQIMEMLHTTLKLRLLPSSSLQDLHAIISYAHPRFDMRTLSSFTKVKVQKLSNSQHKPRSQTSNMWPGNEIQHKVSSEQMPHRLGQFVRQSSRFLQQPAARRWVAQHRNNSRVHQVSLQPQSIAHSLAGRDGCQFLYSCHGYLPRPGGSRGD